MKKALSFLFAFALLTTAAGAVDLYVDTNKISTDTPPVLVDGRTLVPVRAIFESIGASVDWNPETRTATGSKDGTVVTIQIGSTTAYVNGEAKSLDVPAQIINDRTMVPARFVSEALECEVTWHPDSATAAVANELKGRHIYVTPTGAHYHFDGSCNGGTYYEATLAEAMGRGLTPCGKCADPSQANNPPAGGSGNGDNFHTYDDPNQQQTTAQWVLNTKSKKIHYPTCRDVPRISPDNYAVSNQSERALLDQGYTTCGHCHR